MAITVVVGAQYGSEGKGKVVHYLARTASERPMVVRVGGPNSGHTVVRRNGDRLVLRQLPTPALIPGVRCVIGAGSYILPDLLANEVAEVRLSRGRLAIDPAAVVITADLVAAERESRLRERIGSTESGTGAAVAQRVRRDTDIMFAKDYKPLRQWVQDTHEIMRRHLSAGGQLLVEGTQGYGLSVMRGEEYPFVTSRDTTAAGCIAEAGLSPLDVSDVVLVSRAFPIRVPGSSGPLRHEIGWQAVTEEGQHDHPILEYTSVTHSVRRVARVDPVLLRRAISVNQPTRIVLNHLDYLDHRSCISSDITPTIAEFIERLEGELDGRRIDLLGLGPSHIMNRPDDLSAAVLAEAS